THIDRPVGTDQPSGSRQATQEIDGGRKGLPGRDAHRAAEAGPLAVLEIPSAALRIAGEHDGSQIDAVTRLPNDDRTFVREPSGCGDAELVGTGRQPPELEVPGERAANVFRSHSTAF